MQEYNYEQHLMVLEQAHETGNEEWVCPTCGRRLMIQWRPSFNWMVLSPGDEYAAHSGAKGGLDIQGMSAGSNLREQADGSLKPEEEAKLKPWIEWMEKNGFEKLWDQEN